MKGTAPRSRRRAGWVLVAGVLAGCFESPVVGEVSLDLSTPNQDDGAVSFVVSVAAPDEIRGASAACSGCQLVYQRVGSQELRGVVLGDLAPGPVVRLAVSQAAPNQAYRIQIVEVASRQFQVRPPAGYDLLVRR